MLVAHVLYHDRAEVDVRDVLVALLVETGAYVAQAAPQYHDFGLFVVVEALLDEQLQLVVVEVPLVAVAAVELLCMGSAGGLLHLGAVLGERLPVAAIPELL